MAVTISISYHDADDYKTRGIIATHHERVFYLSINDIDVLEEFLDGKFVYAIQLDNNYLITIEYPMSSLFNAVHKQIYDSMNHVKYTHCTKVYNTQYVSIENTVQFIKNIINNL